MSVFLHTIWGSRHISFFACYISFFTKYIGPLRSVSPLTICSPAQVSFFAYYKGPPQISFCAYLLGPLSDQCFLLLYGTPQIIFLAYYMGAPQISFFAYYIGAPPPPPPGQFLRLLYGAPLIFFSFCTR